MASQGRALTTWEAACTITGYSVGSGIMALPYLMEHAGFVPGLVILVIAFFFSYCMHMLIAELAMGARESTQIVGIFAHYARDRKGARPIAGICMVIIVFALLFAQAGFISGGADVIETAGIPHIAAVLIFYCVAAFVVFFGLKVIGVSESISVTIILAVIAVLAVGTVGHATNSFDIPTGTLSQILAFYGMAMFAFVAFFSVPQAVEGLERDVRKVHRAILLGLGMNLVLIFVIVGCSLAASPQVTELAIIGWSAGIGTWAQVLGSVFTVLALLTTYWSNSLACSDMIHEQFHLRDRLCWLISTLPSLILVFVDLGGFMSMMRIASGLVAILIALSVPFMAIRAEKMNGRLFLIKPWMASKPMLALLVVAFVGMAVGSMIPA